MSFVEWEYLDGTHTIEKVDYIALSEGRYEMNDDSTWEVGSFEISGNKSFDTISFDNSFSKKPYLILTMQTTNGGQTVTVGAKDVTSSGFKASLFEEDDVNNGHVTERISYLAIATNQHEDPCEEYKNTPVYLYCTDTRVSAPEYSLSSREMTHVGADVDGQTFYNQEEKSADSETSHTTETINFLTINGVTFAQQVSSNGSDTTSFRKK